MFKKGLLTVILLVSSISIFGGVKDKIDWPSYMAKQDLVWEDLPHQWNECAFVGNGQLGMSFYSKLDENRFNIHIGRQDVTDHRKASDKKTSMGVKGANLLDFSRLDIGKFALYPAGKIETGNLRQDLWNAEVRGTIITDLGEITFRAFTPYNDEVQIVEISSTETVDGERVPFRYEWMPGDANCCRVRADPKKGKHALYVFNENTPVISEQDGVNTCVQAVDAGGDYATAWANTSSEKDNSVTLFVSTANEIPRSNVSNLNYA